ncbi:MAG: ABC transporter permease [Vicinamibacterales bacterium]|nr:ABC transporter permease [Vicinamibacterales bacterium]
MTKSEQRARQPIGAALAGAATLAVDSLRAQPARSTLAVAGIVIGIVTVVLVASVLVGLRNSVAQLFRELGTENIFAFHRGGDPYSPPTEAEANRRPLDLSFVPALERLGPSIREVGAQVLVPAVTATRTITARAGVNESDTVIIEGVTPNFHEITGAEFEAGRPFTELESRVAAPVAVLGANIARALFGGRSAVGQSFLLGGDRYFVVGELAARRGTFFGENRNDSVVSIPAGTARRKFPEAEQMVLYIRAEAGARDEARTETETILRLLRGVPLGAPSDFTLSTADQIIAQFDRIGAQIFIATAALAAVSLLIGGIGIANVMIISVTERTREIGLRLAVGARRPEVLRQFLLEAALLSGIGGLTGVVVATGLGLVATAVAPGFPAVPPLWAVASGLGTSVLVGVVAGYWPARRASGLDPVEALRYE